MRKTEKEVLLEKIKLLEEQNQLLREKVERLEKAKYTAEQKLKAVLWATENRNVVNV